MYGERVLSRSIKINDKILGKQLYNNRIIWPLRQVWLKPPPFHGGIVGSNPAEVTNNADIV